MSQALIAISDIATELYRSDTPTLTSMRPDLAKWIHGVGDAGKDLSPEKPVVAKPCRDKELL